MKRTFRIGGRVSCVIYAWAVASLLALPAMAAEWNFVGARYQAMGGSGVASVNDAFASYWNPAALANGESADADINLDFIASIEGDVVKTLDDLEDIENDVGDLLDAIEGGDLIADQEEIDELTRFTDAIVELDDGQGAVGTASAGLALRWRQVAAFSRFDGQFALSSVTDDDNLELPGIGQDFDDIDNGLDQNESGARVRGLGVIESGFGYGHKFEVPFSEEVTQGLGLDNIGIDNLGAISVGANLKYLHGITFNKFVIYRDADDADLDFGDKDLREESGNFGLDIGLLYEPTDWLAIGMMARNVNSPKFDAAADDARFSTDEYKLHAQVRGGIAIYPLSDRSLVIASDLDLTENESELLDGFDSRLWSVGVEYTLPIPAVQLALRGGGYMNTVGDAANDFVLTGGLGLRVWLLSFDLAAGASPETIEVGDGNDYPKRVNVSAVLALKGHF